MDHHGNGACLGDGWNGGGLVGDGGRGTSVCLIKHAVYLHISVQYVKYSWAALSKKYFFFLFVFFFLNSRSGKKPDCIEAKLRRAPPGVHQRTARPPPAPMIWTLTRHVGTSVNVQIASVGMLEWDGGWGVRGNPGNHGNGQRLSIWLETQK